MHTGRIEGDLNMSDVELSREVKRLRTAIKKIEGDALVAETRSDAQAIARYAHQVLTD